MQTTRDSSHTSQPQSVIFQPRSVKIDFHFTKFFLDDGKSLLRLFSDSDYLSIQRNEEMRKQQQSVLIHHLSLTLCQNILLLHDRYFGKLDLYEELRAYILLLKLPSLSVPGLRFYPI